MLRSLFDRNCTIKRLVQIEDEYKTPKGEDWKTIGTSRCRLSRKNLRATQEAPDLKTNESYMLYMPIGADIKAGDRVTLNGDTKDFTAGPPYKPGNHHIEVEVWREGSA
ncbi:DUF3599 family protein [Paenibacillus tyrfis]|uniref:Phage protein n=1 Tax=Paenibacillus tyrfis TaxID=1501230 RepID=A0A081P4F2_9BACL|nr:DUF3599 family protein [Paenibacillus tyrfis]KEQ25575.1 hypothetical protein ET33_02310 [Paenibacillus tyrfis]